MLEQLAEAYWNAFRDGFMRVGGTKDYPKWGQSDDPVKAETLRCLRHAVECLRPEIGDEAFDKLFPEPLQKRSGKMTLTDAVLAGKLTK